MCNHHYSLSIHHSTSFIAHLATVIKLMLDVCTLVSVQICIIVFFQWLLVQSHNSQSNALIGTFSGASIPPSLMVPYIYYSNKQVYQTNRRCWYKHISWQGLHSVLHKNPRRTAVSEVLVPALIAHTAWSLITCIVAAVMLTQTVSWLAVCIRPQPHESLFAGAGCLW